MAEQLVDGTGTGDKLKIDSRNRLRAFSVTESEDKDYNKIGESWSLYFTATPTGVTDEFFYLENTGETSIAISDIRVMCAAAETITIKWVTGTPTYSGATDAAVTPKNGGSSKVPNITAKSDPDITTLTDDGVIDFMRLDTANKLYDLDSSSNIIVPQGAKLAFEATTGTNLITCIVSIQNINLT